MQDSMKGWASTFLESSFQGAIWETSDGGKTWTIVGNSTPCSSVRPLAGGRLASEFGGAAILNSRVALKTPAVGSPIQQCSFTLDGGVSWQTGADIDESWGVYLNPIDKKFYISPEDPTALLPGQVYASSDLGATWNRISNLPRGFQSTGDIQGAGNTIYIQSSLDNPYANSIPSAGNLGIWRSLDAGVTFIPVGGPTSELDTRISVPPSCNGGVVVAADSTSLWMTTDGGDGLLAKADAALEASGFQGTSTCARDSELIIISNMGCFPMILQSASLDSELMFSLSSVNRFPDTLRQGTADTIRIFFQPHFRPGVHLAHVHLLGSVAGDSLAPAYDSTISITAGATAQPPILASSSYFLDLGDLSTCSGIDTSVTLRNLGCDTLVIDSLQRGTASWLRINGVTLPFRLPPDSAVSYKLSITPPTTGPLYQNFTWHVSQEGLTRTVQVEISANGVASGGRLSLSSTSVNAGSISYCAGDTLLPIVLTNAGCDTLSITNIRLAGSPDYSLQSQIADVRIFPDSNQKLSVRFKPSTKGPRSSQVSFHVRYLHGSDAGHDTAVTITGNGLGGSKALLLSLATIDLGTIYPCQNADTVITLINPGCDTLTIASGLFDNQAYSINASFPMMLAPGASITERVHFAVDTTGHPLVLPGGLQITSDADSAKVRVIQFTTEIVYPEKLRLELLPFDSAKAGSKVTFILKLAGEQPKGISALHFDLTHNDDLLGYQKFAGRGLQLDGSSVANSLTTQSFSLMPVIDTGVIGSLDFEVFLAKNSSTPLTFSNIRLDTPLPIESSCLASVADSGASFSYIYQCGDSIVQMILARQPLGILSIVPNPAKNLLRIEFIQSPSQAINAEIFDLLGARRFSGFCASKQSVLDISKLPEGTYYLRCSTASFVESRRIVVLR